MKNNLKKQGEHFSNYDSVMKFVSERTRHGVDGVYDLTEIDRARIRYRELREKTFIREAKRKEAADERLAARAAIKAFLPLLGFMLAALLLLIIASKYQII